MYTEDMVYTDMFYYNIYWLVYYANMIIDYSHMYRTYQRYHPGRLTQVHLVLDILRPHLRRPHFTDFRCTAGHGVFPRSLEGQGSHDMRKLQVYDMCLKIPVGFQAGICERLFGLSL